MRRDAQLAKAKAALRSLTACNREGTKRHARELKNSAAMAALVLADNMVASKRLKSQCLVHGKEMKALKQAQSAARAAKTRVHNQELRGQETHAKADKRNAVQTVKQHALKQTVKQQARLDRSAAALRRERTTRRESQADNKGLEVDRNAAQRAATVAERAARTANATVDAATERGAAKLKQQKETAASAIGHQIDRRRAATKSTTTAERKLRELQNKHDKLREAFTAFRLLAVARAAAAQDTADARLAATTTERQFAMRDARIWQTAHTKLKVAKREDEERLERDCGLQNLRPEIGALAH